MAIDKRIPKGWKETVERLKKLETEMREISALCGVEVQVSVDPRHNMFTVWVDDRYLQEVEGNDSFTIFDGWRIEDEFHKSTSRHAIKKGEE